MAITTVIIGLIIVVVIYVFKEQIFLKIIGYTDTHRNKAFLRSFHTLFPHIQFIDTSTNEPQLVECSRHATRQYKCINMEKHLSAMSQSRVSRESIDNLLSDLIEHVQLNGMRVDLEDCIICDVLNVSGSYFPTLHTDMEWDLYESDGFQVWYLIRNDDDDVGNMFVWDADTPETPVFIRKNSQCDMAAYSHISRQKIRCLCSTQGTMKYLRMRQGDCFIFGQRLAHMSDWRLPPGLTRHALNFRVFIRKNKHICLKNHPNIAFRQNFYRTMHMKRLGGTCNYVSRYQLSGI